MYHIIYNNQNNPSAQKHEKTDEIPLSMGMISFPEKIIELYNNLINII